MSAVATRRVLSCALCDGRVSRSVRKTLNVFLRTLRKTSAVGYRVAPGAVGRAASDADVSTVVGEPVSRPPHRRSTTSSL